MQRSCRSAGLEIDRSIDPPAGLGEDRAGAWFRTSDLCVCVCVCALARDLLSAWLQCGYGRGVCAALYRRRTGGDMVLLPAPIFSCFSDPTTHRIRRPPELGLGPLSLYGLRLDLYLGDIISCCGGLWDGEQGSLRKRKYSWGMPSHHTHPAADTRLQIG